MTANFTQPHGLLDYWRDMLISLDYWPCQADSLSPCDDDEGQPAPLTEPSPSNLSNYKPNYITDCLWKLHNV